MPSPVELARLGRCSISTGYQRLGQLGQLHGVAQATLPILFRPSAERHNVFTILDRKGL